MGGGTQVIFASSILPTSIFKNVNGLNAFYGHNGNDYLGTVKFVSNNSVLMTLTNNSLVVNFYGIK